MFVPAHLVHFLFILVSSHLILLLPTLWHLIAYNVLMCRQETAHSRTFSIFTSMICVHCVLFLILLLCRTEGADVLFIR